MIMLSEFFTVVELDPIVRLEFSVDSKVVVIDPSKGRRQQIVIPENAQVLTPALSADYSELYLIADLGNLTDITITGESDVILDKKRGVWLLSWYWDTDKKLRTRRPPRLLRSA